MPKAYADSDLYESEIEERNATLRSTVEESKWLVDLCALLALAIGSNALFFALVSRAYHDGVTLRLAFGIVVILVISLSLLTPARGAINAALDAKLCQVQQLLGAPRDWHNRHVVVQALWHASRNTIGVLALWGTGFAFAELTKMSAFL